MKRNNILTEIQSNLKKLTDSQLADVADYIEMIMGGPEEDSFDNEEKYDEEDYNFLDGEDGSFREDFDEGYY